MKRQELSDYRQTLEDRYTLSNRIYSMRHIEGLSIPQIMEITGLTRSKVYSILHNFEIEHQDISEQMRKNGKDVTPKDYQDLKAELAKLQKELRKEKLRADFYEEMVAYGKEVYGIDLKKAGTK